METRQPGVWAAALVTYFAALVAFLLRLLARRLKGVPLNWGDWLACAAFLCTTAYTILNLCKIRYGLGLHIQDLGLGDIKAASNVVSHDYFRLLWVDMWIYTSAVGLSKLTALALYWFIFGQTTIRVPILILSASVVGWMVARVVVTNLLCIPITKFWNPEETGTCGVPTNAFFFGSTIPHLLMEVAIVVLPCIKIRHLNLPVAQKIAVGGMFASGTFVCVASMYQLIQAIELDTSSLDLWWTSTPQTIAAIIEINLGHFSTSLPNLRPILDIITGRRSLAETRASPLYGYSTRPSERSRKRGDVFSHKPDEGPKNDSELELAQYEGLVLEREDKAMPGEIWKCTTTEVRSSSRDSS